MVTLAASNTGSSPTKITGLSPTLFDPTRFHPVVAQERAPEEGVPGTPKLVLRVAESTVLPLLEASRTAIKAVAHPS